MDNCIICKSHLINKKQTIRSRMRDKNGEPQGDMIRYKAWCPKCEIYLRKTKQGKTEGHWRISMVKESDKITEICESEFLKIKYNLEKELENIDDKFISEDYVTIEPYINYEKDIRYLAIGNKTWAMARKGKFWKANIQTTDFVMIEQDETLINQTKKLQEFLKADILAIDILEDKNENKFIVEYNDIPGLSGFPDEVKTELAKCIN